MMNKKYVAMLAASLAAVTLISGCGGSQSGDKKDAAKEQKTLVVGTEATFPPFESVENDKVGGFDMGLTRQSVINWAIRWKLKTSVSMPLSRLSRAVR